MRVDSLMLKDSSDDAYHYITKRALIQICFGGGGSISKRTAHILLIEILCLQGAN